MKQKTRSKAMTTEKHASTVFMVDRDLPGITMEQLAGAQRAAIETSQRFTAEGKPIRYIRTTFVPGEARCLCLFAAPDAATVQAVNEAAQLPFTRIVEAMDLTP
jgi:muconolactone delta-isomerase